MAAARPWPGVSQSSACPHVPQRLSHEWVNQPHLEPMYVFLANASVLTHTRCVRQPLKHPNPRFQHSELSFSRAGLSGFLGATPAAPISCRRTCRTKYLLFFATLNKFLLGWAAGAGSRAPSSVTHGSVRSSNYLGSVCLIRAVEVPSSLVHLVTVQEIHG